MIQPYRRMLRVLGDHAPQMQRNVRISTIASVLEGCIYALLFPLMLALFEHPINTSRLGILLAISGGLFAIETVLRWQELTFSWDAVNEISHDTRLKLGEQLRRIPLEQLTNRRSGELNVILGGNVSEIVLWLGSLCLTIIQTLVVPCVTIAVMFWIDWRLAIALTLTFPLAIPIYQQFRKIVGQGTRQTAIADAETASRVIEYAQGLPVLRATKQVGSRSQQIQKALANQRATQSRTNQLVILPSLMIATLVEIGILLIIALGSVYVLQGSLSLPILIALLVIAVRFSEPLAVFANYAAVFDITEAALERIEALLSIQPLVVLAPTQAPEKFDISFESVTFTYLDQSEPVLRNISLHCPERSFTALVGSSGSGKTTITRLISRYADVQQGKICIGGIDIRHIDPTQLMRLVSVVFQDVYLFDDTIYNNIRLAKPGSTDVEVEAAAQAANCHDFISRLPNGYETRVGEIGGALSGGERQRISIARAILKDAPIVLLDEPTSALDTESEVAVQRAIDRLVENKTVIVIAHRLSTVVGADQILVLESGQMIEQGTHSQLLELQGRYASLWKIQQNAYCWRIVA
ncbi:ABC transporter ATP-binding protein [Myxacorys almedinensis]|uniref:ATP-binding cassette domain-containing protein n=1 Tax=Myxacorys almedinensis A TaxID=2690445 RepID=A0A8J7Z1H5_9CYAN|nr:ABC transporter ATP-binding protein [Myxacorys almedinensis]NDJ18597.1 ATP-binding cassette domain-containing protein [Myxacorys almedinensis A]